MKDEFEQAVHQVLADLDLPTVSRISMYSSAYWSTPLLDGMVIEYGRYGMGTGDLTSGMRVVGYTPLRALCALLDLEAPRRRFKGEEDVASDRELLARLEAQQARPRQELEDFAHQGLVGDRLDLLTLIYSLFGDRGLPKIIGPDLQARIPAAGTWGERRFSMLDRERYEALDLNISDAARWRDHGFASFAVETLVTHCVDLDDAVCWKELGCDARDTIRLLPFGIDTAEPWLRAGISPALVARALDEDLPLDAFLEYRAAGAPDSAVFSFIAGGLGPDAVPEYVVAEAVAYIVGQRLGLDTSSYSAGYVASWAHGDSTKLHALAERIDKAARPILAVFS